MPDPTALPTSPQDAAERALAAITPSTEVTTSGIATVAGRSAHELVLKPREASSLVAQVRVAIDGTEHVPLRVQVFAKSVPDPVFEVAFSAVDFARPDDAQFAFKAPPGTTVTEGKDPAGVMNGHEPSAAEPGSTDPDSKAMAARDAVRPKVVGEGWGSVLVATMPDAGGTADPGADRSLDQLTQFAAMLPKVSGSWGSGHLLAGTVFSVLLTDDGRIVAGAVTPQALYAALAGS